MAGEEHAAGPAVACRVHPDPRAQALLEQIREREIEQAVARLRLVHRDRPATVYLLTNLPLNLEVAELTTWNALVRDREAEACRRWGGVWLVSPSERSRCAPDLWPTPKAAKRDAEKRNEAPNSSIEVFRALGGLIPQPRRRSSTGTRGSAARIRTVPTFPATAATRRQPVPCWRRSPARWRA